MNGNRCMRVMFFLTALFIAATPHAQESAPQPPQGQQQQQPKLSGSKVALIIVEPPTNWVSLETAVKAGESPEGIDESGAAWLRFSAAMDIASRLKSEGADVRMLFMGPAVVWLAVEDIPAGQKGGKPASAKGVRGPHDAIEKLKAMGVSISADEPASTHHSVHDKISTRSVEFFNSKGGAPGVVGLIARGYQILIF